MSTLSFTYQPTDESLTEDERMHVLTKAAGWINLQGAKIKHARDFSVLTTTWKVQYLVVGEGLCLPNSYWPSMAVGVVDGSIQPIQVQAVLTDALLPHYSKQKDGQLYRNDEFKMGYRMPDTVQVKANRIKWTLTLTMALTTEPEKESLEEQRAEFVHCLYTIEEAVRLTRAVKKLITAFRGSNKGFQTRTKRTLFEMVGNFQM